jgi:ACR3 family arsenite efflux pump ArsB
MFSLLQKLSQRLTIAIPAALFLGFLYGLYFDAASLKGLVLPLTFLMVYPMMINLDWGKLLKFSDGRLVLFAQVANFIVVPALAFILGVLFFPSNPYMALGLFLSSLFPTSGMTITWTGFSRGNVEAAVKMTLIGLTLGSLLSPFYLKLAMGKVIPVNLAEIFRQIMIIIVIPLLLGALTRNLLVGRYGQSLFKTKIAPKFLPFSTLGVLGIVFVAIALKARTIAANPAELLFALLPIIILYALNILFITFFARKLFSYEDGVALVFGTVARNLSIALALAINAFGEKGSDAALVLSAAFIVQSQAMAWYSKLTGRLLRKGVRSSTIREAEIVAKT